MALNKTQLLEIASDLGIEVPEDATNRVIGELIEAAEVEVVEEAPVAEEFVITNASGKYIRTYSVEIHGKDAGKLAQQFAGSNNCTIN